MSTRTTCPRSSSAVSGSEFSQTGARSSAREVAVDVVDRGHVVLPGWLIPRAAEQVEQEQEDVEDVEEDARGDADGAAGIGAAQAVGVEDRERPEDPETRDDIDDVAVGDRDEGRDDPEADQAQQRPEQRAGPRGKVSARGV